MTIEIDLRFILEDDTSVKHLIRAIGENLEDVISIVELRNDGFGHIVPNNSTRQDFVGGL